MVEEIGSEVYHLQQGGDIMTKQEMRQRFFQVKNQLSDALVSRGFNHTNDEEFYKAIQNVWKEMNEITPKFK